MQASARMLLLLCLTFAVLADAKQDQKAANAAADRASVPGQAFHDWRNSLLAAKYSTASNSATTSSSTVSTSNADKGAAETQQHAVQPDNEAPAEWVNIVARRESLEPLKGPAARTTTHPAAKQRLRLAQALLAVAAADADAAAKATAEALSRLVAPKGPGQDHSTAAGKQQQQQQQQGQEQPENSTHRGGVFLDRKLLQDSATAKAKPAASSTASGPTAADNLNAEQQQRLQQLTQLMREQPYKPTKIDPAVLESTLMHFVHRGPSRLYVQGKPWLLRGMDVPEALQLAAGGPVPRSQLMYLLDRAQTLGLNTVRFRAFADGAPGVGSAVPREWSQQDEDASSRHIALQPAPGILNGTMLREGLDWLVHECGMRGIRLLPVLTNGGSNEGGGMKQYIDWIDPALTVTDFYKNDTIKSVFLDYVAAMLGHVSSFSGLPLREDPVILGWQLAEEASHPGSPSSQTLLAWLRQLGVFLKQRAPHQLFLPGVKDLFGHNSPHHLQYNPQAQVFEAASHSPLLYQPRCHGVDFWLHNQMPEVDAVPSGVFPDMHMACNATCKLDWTREWIRAHLRDALRMNKPAILGGIGALRPQSWRLQVLQVVQEEIERALKYGHPIGGFVLSGLSHPDMPDTTGWGTYYTVKGVHKERQPLADLNAQAVMDVEWRRFMNYEAFLTCQVQQTRGAGNDTGEASNTVVWVDGWDDVVRAVSALAKLPDDASTAAKAQ